MAITVLTAAFTQRHDMPPEEGHRVGRIVQIFTEPAQLQYIPWMIEFAADVRLPRFSIR
jgi:hypothetical protein